MCLDGLLYQPLKCSLDKKAKERKIRLGNYETPYTIHGVELLKKIKIPIYAFLVLYLLKKKKIKAVSDQESVNFFCEGPDNKYITLCGLWSLLQLFTSASSTRQPQTMHKQRNISCFTITLFTKTSAEPYVLTFAETSKQIWHHKYFICCSLNMSVSAFVYHT